jgi:RNA polymerase sigma-70 factor, ECF subfamily
VSAGALSLSRVVPTPPPPTAAELKLLHLVERVQRDDLAAFEELYRLTRDDVARTLFHLVGARADLEDLLQDTYLKLLKAVPRYKGQSRFRTFLYGVCANVALMHLRWWRRRREDVMADLPETIAPGQDPEAVAQSKEAQRLVQRALASMSAKKRIVFVYHELCDMGPEEIAEATDTPYNTVRSRLHHARMEFTQNMRALTGEVAS